MASKAGVKASSNLQQKTAGIQMLQANDLRPFSQPFSKPELATPEQLPKSLQNTSKQVALEASENKKLPSSTKNGSIDSLLQKLNSASLSEQASTEVDSVVNETRGSLGSSVDQEKKTSEYGSVKNSSVSAKVSDGASSLAKTSGSAKISDRLDFVESGKSSMCRGSTSSDVSDESTCSSFSSSINKPHKANDMRWEAIQAVRSKDGMLGLGHFRLLKRLGCGDIGSVYLSELSGTKCYFAMKVMDKGSLASRKKLLRAQTEREILQSLDHPFLPTLYTHFETEKFSCLVMEFCPGGDLHTLRQKQPGKHFPEQAVKFYVAEVLLALEYLHMLGIVYRDLKPENVLVREDGHIMLSDFDLSLRCTVSPTLVKTATMESEPSRKNPVYCVQPACIEPSCIQPSCVAPTTCFSPRIFSSKSKKDRKPKNEVGNQVSPLPELVAEPTDARSMSFVGLQLIRTIKYQNIDIPFKIYMCDNRTRCLMYLHHPLLLDRSLFDTKPKTMHSPSLPSHSLESLLDSTRPFLRGEFETIDKKLPALVAVLRSVGAGECWHKHGSFLDHLIDMYRILKIWKAQDSICLCGLFHSAYSNSYVNLAIFDPSTGREVVRNHVGDAAERLIHLFCIVPRQPLIHDDLLFHYSDSELVEHLKNSDLSVRKAKEKGLFDRGENWREKVRGLVPDDGIVVKHIKTGEDVRVSRRVVAVFLMMTMADFSDQLFGFQDVLFENFDGRLEFKGNNFVAGLWPGDVKPGLWMNSISRMGALYNLIVREEEIFVEERKRAGGKEFEEGRDEDLELVIPPVFENCTRVLDADEQIAARDLYWEGVCDMSKRGLDLLDGAEELLLKCVEKNPFIGEPHVVLGQVYLAKGRFEEAEKEAEKGLILMLEWGSPWDKRTSWEGWIAWARVLLMKAKEKSWPQTSWGILNLGLVK